MKKSTKIMILSLVSVIFVLLLVLGITKSFMKPIEQGGNITEVSLNSCAKIKLTSTSNVNLSSSYPMSRNKGLQTTPYKFTVTSYCDSYVGFNLYVATLSTNTIDAKYVRYILTETGTKNVIQEGILSSATNGVSDFTDTEKTELNTGLKGTYGSIYKIHSENIPLKGTKSFDIYLFLDGDVADNSTMGKTFKAGVAVKSYEREADPTSLADYVKSLYTGTQGTNNIYYHDSSLTNGAGDNSYRFAGASDKVNNYVCFGSTQSPCPADNLYRIIGVFGDKVKLIKSDYATSALLGADGDYKEKYSQNSSNYKGNNLANIAAYTWNYKNNTTINNGYGSNTWSTSLLNKTNLNKNFITNIGADWAAKIADTTWKVGGNTGANIYSQPAKTAYQNEIVSPVTTNTTDNATTFSAKVGLMYASDYGFAAAPSAWTANLSSYNGEAIKNVNWMYMGLVEWTISRIAYDAYNVFYVTNTGYVYYLNARSAYGVRPVFYLSSSVNYASGSGTAADPILVN